MGGVAKKEITKFGCENFVCWVTFGAPSLGMLVKDLEVVEYKLICDVCGPCMVDGFSSTQPTIL